MVEMRLIEAVRAGLQEEMAADPGVFIIGQDIGINGGVFRVTEGLLQEFGADRVIDSPLAESGLVGVAIGAALNGMRQVVEIQFADFIFPAFNQLVSEAAKLYYRSNGEFPVPIVVRTPYGGGVRGGLYHSQSVEAYFAHVPGLKVVVPSSPHDAKGLLKAAIRDNNPVLLFEHKLAYNTVRGEVPDGDFTVPIGQATPAPRAEPVLDLLRTGGAPLPGSSGDFVDRGDKLRGGGPAHRGSFGHRHIPGVGQEDRPGVHRPRG